MSQSQKMSLTGAILMNVNLMVGASAFIGPGMMAQYADSASFYGWIFAAALFFPVVWCISKITAHFPGKGSFYSYPSNTISQTAGFMSGWVYFLGYVSIGAMQLTSLNELILRKFEFPFLQHYPFFFNMLIVGILMTMALLSINVIDRIQSSATIFKITPLIIGVVSLLYYFSPAKTPAIWQTAPQLLIPTIPVAIFGFWGFEGVCSISHLIENSKENAGRAILYGFLTAVSIYCLFHLSMLSIMGPKALKTFGAESFVSYMGLGSPLATHALNVLIVSAIIAAHINAVFGGMVANSSMFCAMAEDKLVFLSSLFSTRMPKTDRPLGALALHCLGIMFCITVFSGKEVLTAMSNLGVLIAFFMAIASLIVVQQKRNELIGLVVSALGLGSCSVLAYCSWQIMGISTAARATAAAPLIIIMLLGYIMFLHAKRVQSR